jgi:hypothetical protein
MISENLRQFIYGSPVMFYVVTWFIVVVLLSLWSFTAWALHAIAIWSLSSAGSLSGATTGLGEVALPDWLPPWLPQEIAQWTNALVAGLGPLVESLLEFAPALAGGLTVLTWGVWGIGSALLLLVGAGLHFLIAQTRRRGGSLSNLSHTLSAG